MIYYIATERHRYTIDKLLEDWGDRLPAAMTPVAYEALLEHGLALARGAYVFTDLERLTPLQLESAARIWDTLDRWGRPVRLLNHPTRARMRYEFLRELNEAGINSYNVYRLTEARRPQRYPVFIRNEQNHRGSESRLLDSRDELDQEIARIDASGRSRESRLIVEFCGATDRRGHYRKYSAFRIGDRILPRSINVAGKWVVKRTTVAFDDALQKEEHDFIRDNPHEATLLRAFEIARIDFGRVDFALVDGRVEIYEINTNPTLYSEGMDARHARYSDLPPRTETMLAAFAALDPAPEVPLPPPRVARREAPSPVLDEGR